MELYKIYITSLFLSDINTVLFPSLCTLIFYRLNEVKIISQEFMKNTSNFNYFYRG